MHFRIAVDLAGRGEQQPRAGLLGQPQQVARADHVGQHRVLGIGLVVRRRGRAGEMIDVGELDAARRAATAAGCRSRHARRTRSAAHRSRCREIFATAGLEIVEADDLRAFGEQAVAQVRSEEPGASGHQRNLSGADASLDCSFAVPRWHFAAWRRPRCGCSSSGARCAAGVPARMRRAPRADRARVRRRTRAATDVLASSRRG